MIHIELNPFEQRLAKALAKARYESSRSTKTRNMKIGPQSNEVTDLEGIASEIAFCKYMNVYPDISVGSRNAADCTLHSGHTVDVKSTKRGNGRLLVAAWKKPEVDIFALMIGEFPNYFTIGWISADQLLRPEMMLDLGYGKSYAASQDILLPMELLKELGNGKDIREKIPNLGSGGRGFLEKQGQNSDNQPVKI